MEWFLKVVKENYANFNGRARRKEYWTYTLCVVALNFAIGIVGGILGFVSEVLDSLVMVLSYLVSLGLVVPSLAVGVRRLHDTGKSGWFLLLGLIPLVNFYLLYLLVIEGDQRPNEFGPDPKEGESGFPSARGGTDETGRNTKAAEGLGWDVPMKAKESRTHSTMIP